MLEKIFVSYVADGSVNWHNHFGKAVWQYFMELNSHISYKSALFLLEVCNGNVGVYRNSYT